MLRDQLKEPVPNDLFCEWIVTSDWDEFEYAKNAWTEIKEAISDKFEAQIVNRFGFYDKYGNRLWD